MNKNLIFFYFFIAASLTEAKYVPDIIAEKTLQEVALSTLDYSLQDQVDNELDQLYLKGEFRTRIYSSLVPALVGVGKTFGHDEEATAFTTASVINNLGQIYLDHPELHHDNIFKKIPQSIAMGLSTYHRYQDGATYNFYPPYKTESGATTRRPINMTLFPLWYAFTNIPNDSDTTSAVITSYLYDEKINSSPRLFSMKAVQEISSHLDVNRNPMFYNRSEKRLKTGAFMTWLMNEKDPKMPRFPFTEPEKGARIPFVKNDVDCIVNVNILKMLSLMRTKASSSSEISSEISGEKATCDMINDMVAKDENATCGVYYPNTYNLAFSLSAAQKLGNTCLKDENKEILIKKILAEQNADGSWFNLKNIWQDEHLSTIFALTALLEMGDLQNLQVRSSLFYGMHFLLKQAQMKNNLVYWPEENFFTATAIARSLIMWRSKAFTNTLVASLFLKFHKLYPEYKVKNYVQLQF